MGDINKIAKDVNVEVMSQGVKLNTVLDHVTTAVDNTKDGNKELMEA
jgi:hypothetical protein